MKIPGQRPKTEYAAQLNRAQRTHTHTHTHSTETTHTNRPTHTGPTYPRAGNTCLPMRTSRLHSYKYTDSVLVVLQ